MKNFQPLTAAVFYILLVLFSEERHGYGIMKQVKLDSDGNVKMGPGTLYGSIKRMLEDGLIAESETRDTERRKYYKITSLGRQMLKTELDRYKNALSTAKTLKIHREKTNV
jgi:DNA-binding PadR family transcriptional regulator